MAANIHPPSGGRVLLEVMMILQILIAHSNDERTDRADGKRGYDIANPPSDGASA